MPGMNSTSNYSPGSTPKSSPNTDVPPKSKQWGKGKFRFMPTSEGALQGKMPMTVPGRSGTGSGPPAMQPIVRTRKLVP